MPPRETPRKRTKTASLSGKSSREASAKPAGLKRKPDRRVKRTRDVLGDALVALMHEKPFEAIRVQDVLDRAGVSRSTFYTHYTDKNDLLFSDAEDFFGAMATALSRNGDKSNRVAPVREFFEHVAEAEEFRAAMVAANKAQDIMEMGQGFFARGIAQRLAELRGAPAISAARRTALGHAFAGAMFSLLSWWLGSDKAMSAAQLDEMYHRMVWAGIGLKQVPDLQVGGKIKVRMVHV